MSYLIVLKKEICYWDSRWSFHICTCMHFETSFTLNTKLALFNQISNKCLIILIFGYNPSIYRCISTSFLKIKIYFWSASSSASIFHKTILGHEQIQDLHTSCSQKGTLYGRMTKDTIQLSGSPLVLHPPNTRWDGRASRFFMHCIKCCNFSVIWHKKMFLSQSNLDKVL